MTATFLSADLIDEILKESSGSGRYVNPSKIEGELRLRLEPRDAAKVPCGIREERAAILDTQRLRVRPQRRCRDLALPAQQRSQSNAAAVVVGRGPVHHERTQCARRLGPRRGLKEGSRPKTRSHECIG